MTYHIGYSLNDFAFIIINEFGYYKWVDFIQIPSKLNPIDEYFISVDDWIRHCTKYDIHYLGSFTNDTFAEWCAQHPEYFI